MTHADEKVAYEIVKISSGESAIDHQFPSHQDAFDILQKSNHPEDYRIDEVVVAHEVQKRVGPS